MWRRKTYVLFLFGIVKTHAERSQRDSLPKRPHSFSIRIVDKLLVTEQV